MKLTGSITRGRFVCDDPTAWSIAMREHEGQRVDVEIETHRSKRSNAQNARYWGLIVPLAAELLGKTRDVPLSKDQTHYVLASAFYGTEDTPLGPSPKKTSLMTTAEFSEYCERIEAWLSGNGYYLPGPGDEMTA